MPQEPSESWHQSRMRPYARWLAYFNFIWLLFGGVFFLTAGALPADDDLGSPGMAAEGLVVAAICFWLSYKSFRAARKVRLFWNEKTLRTRGLLFAEQSFEWSNLTAIKTGGLWKGWEVSFGPKKMALRFGTRSANISTKGGFIDRRDFDALEALAQQKLESNARTS